MRVSFITTLNHNIGDDFVRDGIKYLLEKAIKEKIEYNYIHKHAPASVRFGLGALKSLKWSERIERFIPIWLTPDKIHNSDIIVQSGAPLYWLNSASNSSKTEWYKPLIQNRFLKYSNKKLLNIGAGSCQNYYSDGSEFKKSQDFLTFVKDFYSISNVTTVRDQLSFNLLNSLNLKVKKIACPSIFSLDFHNVKKNEKKYFVLNYMPGAGHYDFSNSIKSRKWENEFVQFYYYVRKIEDVVFVCHNKLEYRAARKIIKDGDIFYSDNYKDYLWVYSKAKTGIVNRVHAGFILASAGKPVYVIGSDSRAKMCDEINVKNSFVNEVTTEILINEYHRLLDQIESFPAIIEKIKSNAKNSYLNILRQVNK